MAGGLGHGLQRKPFELCDLFCHKRNVGRVVGFAPVRCRREIRAVGLDEGAIKRNKGHDITQVLRTLEGDDAREQNVIKQNKDRAYHLHQLGKTMK